MRKTLRQAIIFILLIATLGCSTVAFGCDSETQNRTAYTINCTLDGNKLTGEETVNFYNDTDNAFSELKFNLFANAFRKDAKFNPTAKQYYNRAYYNGESYGGIEILSVYSGEQKLEFEIAGEDMNVLTVKLLEECYPDETACVVIKYELTLAEVIARTGINADAINLANFYPILCGIQNGGFYECVYYSNGDPYFSDCADYTVTLSRDKKYKVASSGVVEAKPQAKIIDNDTLSTSGEKVNDNFVTDTYTLSNARSFAFALSEKFKTLSDTVGDITVNYYYYKDASPELSLKMAKESMEYFTQTFGEYPYTTYSVVETKFLQGGMEFPALVMISDALEENAFKEVIVHETAHQWWQTTVGNNEIEHGFLDEGLAEYSVVLFYENHGEYGNTRENMVMSAEKTYKAFCSVYDKVFGIVDTTMLRSLDKYTSEYEYVNIAYIKPCIMYDNLRQTIGDKKFFDSLKKYYKDNSFTNATPDDLVGAFEKTGADTNGYFASFFEGKAII